MKALIQFQSNRHRYQSVYSMVLLFLILWLMSKNVLSSSMWKDSLQYHAFITQGIIKTDENRFFGHSDTGSAALIELGINGSSRINTQLMISAQLLARRAGEMYDGSAELDYGLIDYTIHSDASKRYGVRLGRFKNPLGLYNDTRDVAFTRPGVFMPQTIYFDNLRNAFLSNDGVLIYTDLWGDESSISLQVGIGRTPVDLNLEYALVGDDVSGYIDDEDLTLISRILYEAGNTRLALSYVNTSFRMKDTDPVLVSDGEFNVDIWILSLQHFISDWTLTTEWARQPIKWNDFSTLYPAGSSGSNKPGGYFLQASYQLKNNWEILLRYEEGYADSDDKDGTARSAALASPPFNINSPAHNYFTKDWVIGTRWDITSQFMLRAEFHSVEGTYILSRRENNIETTVKDWKLFSILGSYRF